jgi:hypothetical protein
MEEDVAMKLQVLALATLLAGGAVDASAVTLYKLIDRDGRITYLDRPPASFDGRVVPLDIDTSASVVALPDLPPTVPSEVQVPPPVAIDRDAQVAAARRDLEAALKALEDAQNNSRAEDWIYFGQTHRRAPRPEYQARLQALADRVRIAQANLDQAERLQRFD